jgi:hypothetical protein
MESNNNEIALVAARLKGIQEAGGKIAAHAADVKEIADQLRADVDALAARLEILEGENVTVANNLLETSDVVEKQQVKQDDRLDVLENGDN